MAFRLSFQNAIRMSSISFRYNLFTELLALTGAIILNPEDIKCLAAAIDSYMESTGDIILIYNFHPY